LRFAEVRFNARHAKLTKTAATSRRGSPADDPTAYHQNLTRRPAVGHDKAVGAKLQCFQGTRNYEQAQVYPAASLRDFSTGALT